MNKIKTITTAALIGTIGLTGHALLNNHVDAATTMKTTATVNLREGPGTYYKSLGYIAKGSDVRIESFTSNGWAKLDDDKYVSGLYLTKTNYNKYDNSNNSNNKGVYLYTTYNLNLRTNAGTNYSKILTMPKGSKVKYITESNGWAKVTYNGYTGWCCKQYLSNTIKQSKVFINKIVVNRSKHKMYCYSNGTLIRTLDCAVGKPSTPTPTGTCKIVRKIVNPYYSKGNVAGGSSKNPLGKRWMGLNINGTYGGTYGIHGNNNESSIGKSVSNGCMRLHNVDAEWLFDLTAEYKTVVVIY